MEVVQRHCYAGMTAGAGARLRATPEIPVGEKQDEREGVSCPTRSDNPALADL